MFFSYWFFQIFLLLFSYWFFQILSVALCPFWTLIIWIAVHTMTDSSDSLHFFKNRQHLRIRYSLPINMVPHDPCVWDSTGGRSWRRDIYFISISYTLSLKSTPHVIKCCDSILFYRMFSFGSRTSVWRGTNARALQIW